MEHMSHGVATTKLKQSWYSQKNVVSRKHRIQIWNLSSFEIDFFQVKHTQLQCTNWNLLNLATLDLTSLGLRSGQLIAINGLMGNWRYTPHKWGLPTLLTSKAGIPPLEGIQSTSKFEGNA